MKQFLNETITPAKIYFPVFVLYIFQTFINTTTIDLPFFTHPLHWISYLVVFVMIIKIYVFDHYQMHELIGLTILITCFGMAFLKTREIMILSFPMMILGARGVEFKKIIEWFFGLSLSWLLVIVIIALLGIILNLRYAPVNRPIRYALGIGYPTDFAAHVFFLVLAYCYLKFKDLRWLHYVVIGLLAVVVYKITDARLDTVAMLMTIPMIWLAKMATKHQFAKHLMAFSWIPIPLLAVGINYLGIFYNRHNDWLHKIDHLLSGRLYYSQIGFHRYPITLFGQSVTQNGYGGVQGMKTFLGKSNINYFYLDSSFVRLLLMYGLVILILIVTMMVLTSLKGYLRGDYALCAIILLVTVACVVEQHLIEITYNPFLIALCAKIMRKQKNEL